MEDPFSSELLQSKIANQSLPSPLEPKEEPFDEFFLFPTENQVNDDNIFKKEEMYDEEFGIDSFDFPHETVSSSTSAHSKDNTDACEEFEQSLKKSRSGKEKKGKTSDKMLAGREYRKAKENDKELECPQCEFRTRVISSWLGHFRKIHNTTPVQEGFALLCECGVTCRSSKHQNTCKIANFTVIHKAPRNINRDELKCPQCEFRTRSVSSWDSHLREFHGTTPAQAGLALLCDCGVECISRQHINKCNIANFTVIQKKTPRCILCEKYPKTISAYIAHLQNQHNTNINENGIFIICSCGFFLGSKKYNAHCHIKECNGRIFSLRKADDEEFEYSRDLSKIWKYFVKTERECNREKYGRCALCGWGIQLYSGCLVYMWNHLRDLHPMEYSTIQPNESHSANRQYYLTGVGGPVCDIPPSNLILPRPPEEMGEEEFKDGVKEELKEELKEEVKEELMYDY